MRVTYIKNINYFDKNNNLIQCQNVDRQHFDDLQTALQILKNTNLHFVQNKKGISVYEELKIIYRKDNFNYICFNKSIDPITKEVVSNV